LAIGSEDAPTVYCAFLRIPPPHAFRFDDRSLTPTTLLTLTCGRVAPAIGDDVVQTLLRGSGTPIGGDDMNLRTNVLMILAMLTGLAACGPDGGDGPVTSDQIAADGGREVAADASSSPTGIALFLGRWTYVSGNYTITCDGLAPQSMPAAGAVMFTPGDAPDEIVASDGMGCDIPCTVSGNVATAYVGYVCPGDFAVESLVYTVSNGTLREQSTGNAPFASQLCGVSDDAMLAHS
jgi:hypothetical protein